MACFSQPPCTGASFQTTTAPDQLQTWEHKLKGEVSVMWSFPSSPEWCLFTSGRAPMTDQTQFCLSLASRLMSLLGLLSGIWRRAYFQEQKSIKGSCITEKLNQRKRGRGLMKAASLEQALCTTYRQLAAQGLFSPAIVAAYIALDGALWTLISKNFLGLLRFLGIPGWACFFPTLMNFSSPQEGMFQFKGNSYTAWDGSRISPSRCPQGWEEQWWAVPTEPCLPVSSKGSKTFLLLEAIVVWLILMKQ